MKNQELITVYVSGTFGVTKIEGKLIEFGTKPYAQYNNAPYVHMIRKGKRKPEGWLRTYNPYIIILKGHNHPNPDDAFGSKTVKNYESGDVVTKITRFSSFDNRYLIEFDKKIEEYLKNKSVLMDIRHTVETNILNK